MTKLREMDLPFVEAHRTHIGNYWNTLEAAATPRSAALRSHGEDRQQRWHDKFAIEAATAASHLENVGERGCPADAQLMPGRKVFVSKRLSMIENG